MRFSPALRNAAINLQHTAPRLAQTSPKTISFRKPLFISDPKSSFVLQRAKVLLIWSSALTAFMGWPYVVQKIALTRVNSPAA
ncbi:hypothetical protein BZA70DRAFT_295103 [Myxozyma melibiosi]|uniref:Uncharacterized protein n=1 Tax=Myxozyma melibiosi TaxID=54550 RepID=A0ABR1F629_9ASCO